MQTGDHQHLMQGQAIYIQPQQQQLYPSGYLAPAFPGAFGSPGNQFTTTTGSFINVTDHPQFATFQNTTQLYVTTQPMVPSPAAVVLPIHPQQVCTLFFSRIVITKKTGDTCFFGELCVSTLLLAYSSFQTK
jgi:hypothetical protein